MEKYLYCCEEGNFILDENCDKIKQVKYTGEYQNLTKVTKDKFIAGMHRNTDQLSNGFIALLDDIPMEGLISACNSVKPKNWN